MHIYCKNPTAGGTDGTQISEGTGLSPLTIGPLDATKNEESAAIPLAIRTESNYITVAATTISIIGTNAAMWALAPDNLGSAGTFLDYGKALTFSSGQICPVNNLFWIKAKAVSTENPVNDKTVQLSASSAVVAIS